MGNINFEVPNDGLTYVDLAKTWLGFKGRMKKREQFNVECTFLDEDPVPLINKNVPKGSRAGLVNAFAPSLFKAVDIKIGSENITKEVDNYYGYKCLLDIIFSGKTVEQQKELESLLYTKDENSGINVFDPYTGLNSGLLWRSKLASGSKLVEMSMPLFCDLAENSDHHRYIIL